MRYRLFILIIFAMISCNTSSSDKPSTSICQGDICSGDTRLSDCLNSKPDNSTWDSINKNGKFKQVFNGENFVPETMECFWSCLPNYQKVNGACQLKCEDGQIYIDGTCQEKCPDQHEFIDGSCKLVCQTGFHEENGVCIPDTLVVDDDNDGIENGSDNCPNHANPNQEDINDNGIGDACEVQDGSPTSPFIIDVNQTYHSQKDTSNSTYLNIDNYPPNTLNEGGPEYYYIFKLEEITKVKAYIAFPEPEGVDVDVHLLSSLNPIGLIERDHHELEATLNPGIYYIVMDTFVNDSGSVLSGHYDLTVEFYPDYAGTIDEPIELGEITPPFSYTDAKNTAEATSDYFDSYPPNNLDESGKEYLYHFTLTEPAKVIIGIENPEPEGVDVDVHLLSSLNPADPNFLIDRGNYSVYARLEAGDYYISLDSYVEGGVALEGNYKLNININPITSNNDTDFFNYYILEAVEYIDANYRLLGYASANLTHDIEYGDSEVNSENHYGLVTRSGGEKTMCVSAQLEVILTAFQIYAADTGDYTVFEYLPLKSWKTQNEANIKGHIWVNHNYSHGTGHALENFGMGVANGAIEFEDLRPGGFINLNRTTGTGHGVTFLGFLDANGNVYDTYPSNVTIIGFKYYSAQGGYDVGAGGMDYRWAIFDSYDTPTPSFCSSTKKCDKNVIFSRKNNYLNVGMMWHPSKWTTPYAVKKSGANHVNHELEGDFPPANPSTWDGLTSYEIENNID